MTNVFPANIDLSTLNGSDGFRLSGAAAGDVSGFSVASAGDVNGDGFDDLIVGAYRVDANALDSGAGYVVFGNATGFASNIDLSSLDGSTGFRLSGVAESDFSGRSVASAGDVNGDGFADLIIGADAADPNGDYSGASYVVFGKAGGFASNVDLSSLDGFTGFRLNGEAGERSGFSVASAGDVNGDGFADLIVGAPGGDASYVVFGKAGGFASNIDLSSLDGTTGFEVSANFSGSSVASAGDVNGDGFDDLIIGASGASPNGVAYSGASYVVFGKVTGFGSNINLSSLDGSNGFRLSGEAAFDESGKSVASAGDVNGDGFDDLIIGAKGPNGVSPGMGYVVFGKAGGFASNINLSSLDGSAGFRLSGSGSPGLNGYSVASAGDVNGDGFADLIIGTAGLNGASPSSTSPGTSYVVFGKAGGFAANIDLSSLDGSAGFRLSGAAVGDASGRSVASAGDVNGDGFDDLIVGAYGADPHGDVSGASYVVYGRAPDSAVVRVGSAGSQTISGGAFDDTLIGLGGHDVLNGNDGRDTLIGGDGDDVLRGGTGGDVMQGDAGDDTYHADSSQDVVAELAGEGTDTVHTTVSFALGQHVENLVADSDAGLTLRGNSLANSITGGGGNDTLIGGDGDDTYYVDSSDDAVTELANQGTDTVHTKASFTLGRHVENLIADSNAGLILTGNSLANTITGGGGNDTLNGGGGADTMDGGDGDDRYYVDNAGDAVTDSSGRDLIYTSVDHTLGAGIERLYARSDEGLILTGNGADNVIAGRGGDDTLNGGEGNDTLNGGTGADAMSGGLGDDRYFIDNAGDTASDTGGLDSIYTTIDHLLDDSFERLYARSDAGLILTGNRVDNVIVGAAGDDTITGGRGHDVMTGGAGEDTFVFQGLSDSAAGGGRDVIRDFLSGSDRIDLTAIDANTALANDQAFSFIGAHKFTHTAGELQARAFGANTLVSGDVDGNGSADFQILLSGSVALQATDFLL